MTKRKPYMDYKTYDEYIKYIAYKNDLNLKQLCEALNTNYESFKVTYKYRRLNRRITIKLVDNFGAEYDLLMKLPVKYNGKG